MKKTEIIILRDFAEQINIQVSFTNLERTYFTKLNKWPHSKKVWLYIDYFEQWYEKYLFDEKVAIFIADNLEFNNLIWHNTETGENSTPEKKRKVIARDLICKFNLVRIIPKGGTKYFDSYIRVILKDDYESAKPISDEELIHKNTIR